MFFQLTTSRGGRPYQDTFGGHTGFFNSRPLGEVDRIQMEQLLTYCFFNSRPLGEVDFVNTGATGELDFSTHDLSGRSTVRTMTRHIAIIFQLTTSRGGRLLKTRLLRFSLLFNSRPLGEVDSKTSQ